MPRFVAPPEIHADYMPPPSKSYTHRALIAAALAEGTSRILRPLGSNDTRATARALRLLGVGVKVRWDREAVVEGLSRLKPPLNVVDCSSSGTTIRLLTSVSSLAEKGYAVLTGSAQLRRRPMEPLLEALRNLGVHAFSAPGNGRPPVIVEGGGMPGGYTRLDASLSSQFVSSILLAAPRSGKGVTLEVEGLVSKPYVDSTLEVMKVFGARIRREDYMVFSVESSGYRPSKFEVPGDYSSAAFMMALAAMIGGRLIVRGLGSLPQADSAIIDVLAQMGVAVKKSAGSVRIESEGRPLEGGEFDLSDSPDLLPVVAVLGLVSRGGVKISGVEHARVKESDRVSVMAGELRRLGARVSVGRDWIRVEQLREPRSVVLDDHGDHRVYMALAVASAAFGGRFSVRDSDSYKKSYPGFLDDLKKLGVDVY